MLAITTSERGIDTEDDAVVGVEPEPNAVVRFEILEIEIVTSVRDLSGVVEQGGVETAPDLPAVLRLPEDGVRVQVRLQHPRDGQVGGGDAGEGRPQERGAAAAGVRQPAADVTGEVQRSRASALMMCRSVGSITGW